MTSDGWGVTRSWFCDLVNSVCWCSNVCFPCRQMSPTGLAMEMCQDPWDQFLGMNIHWHLPTILMWRAAYLLWFNHLSVDPIATPCWPVTGAGYPQGELPARQVVWGSIIQWCSAQKNIQDSRFIAFEHLPLVRELRPQPQMNAGVLHILVI